MPTTMTLRIMIVESYKGSLKSLSNHLATYTSPLEILAANDATTAMALLQKEPVDLILIDTLLRGEMDGFELCRALRRSYPDENMSIILLLSGYLLLERYKGISAGADLLLLRPVVKEELFKMVELLLGRRFEEARNSHQAASANDSVRRLHLVS